MLSRRRRPPPVAAPEAVSEAGVLSPGRRAEDFARLAGGHLDVLVVGGGITGAGAALDAATRGLSVGLVEAQDWASGTSSRSTKLVHGGLRYLQMMDFRLVHEGLTERALLLQRVAPHLVRPVPVMYPLRRPVIERAYVGAGIALYDLLGLSSRSGRGLPRHRHLTKAQALKSAPGLRADALTGAVLYYDAQVDDARYVVEVVRTAAAYGAVPVNRAGAVRFLFDGGRVAGAVVRDEETGDEHEVRARVTVSATGAWTEETEALAGHARTVRVRPSKGVHLVVPGDRVDATTGLILRTERSVLFVLPWGDNWLIGTTDTDWPFDKARPLATVGDVDYLISEVNSVLARPLARRDVQAVFAGLRPLVAGAGVVRGPGEGRRGASTARLSREHSVSRPGPGLVVVSGGKYTTYRVMARDAIDAAVAEMGPPGPASCTSEVPLIGARAWDAAWQRRQVTAQGLGLPLAVMEHLLRRYGGLADELVAAIGAEPSLAQPLEGAPGYLRAEVAHAVTHEGARHLDDVVSRRTRIALDVPDRGAGAAGPVVELMAPLLNWDTATRTAEMEDFTRQARLVEEAASAVVDDTEAARLIGAVPSLLPFP